MFRRAAFETVGGFEPRIFMYGEELDLALRLSALPVGSTLSDGSHSFVATQANSSVDISVWNLAQLALLPAKNSNGIFTLQVTATATERATGQSASTVAAITLTVLSVNDAPSAAAATLSGAKNTPLTVDLISLVADADHDRLTLTPSTPRFGSLSKNANGSYTYTPNRNFTGTDSISYSVSDGQCSSTATVTINVSNTLVVQSNPSSTVNPNTPHYSVINQASSRPALPANAIQIDWGGSDFNLPVSNNAAWLSEYFADDKNQKTLAELTGLVVRMPA